MVNDFEISDHFNLREFRCPCCGAVILDNKFLAKLEKLRVDRGRVIVSSGGGYRCRSYQRAIHFARNEILNMPLSEPKIAAHTLGQAADVTVYSIDTGDKIPLTSSDIPYLKGLGFTGIGISKYGWAHLDDAHDPFEQWSYSY